MTSDSELPFGWTYAREIPNAAFIDSQGWMAIVHARDQDHAVAAAKFRELAEQRWHLFTSSWTLYDALSHVKERAKDGGVEVAERLWSVANDASLLTLLRVSEEVEKRALELFWRLRDKAWSVTTCANLALMADNGITQVLSANQHYRQAGLIALY